MVVNSQPMSAQRGTMFEFNISFVGCITPQIYLIQSQTKVWVSGPVKYRLANQVWYRWCWPNLTWVARKESLASMSGVSLEARNRRDVLTDSIWRIPVKLGLSFCGLYRMSRHKSMNSGILATPWSSLIRSLPSFIHSVKFSLISLTEREISALRKCATWEKLVYVHGRTYFTTAMYLSFFNKIHNILISNLCIWDHWHWISQIKIKNLTWGVVWSIINLRNVNTDRFKINELATTQFSWDVTIWKKIFR